MTLTIVTPSHAPDVASFARLHRSVLGHTDASVRHLVAVPDADVPLFSSIPSPRLDVRGYRSILPRRFVATTPIARIPGLPRGFRVSAVNVARPWPPIRGWILQQLVKLAVVGELDGTALLIDSDVLVVRPLEESVFRDARGVVRLYRRPGGILPGMRRHVAEQGRARRLLGVDTPEADSPDYIAPFASWDPVLVRQCTDRVSDQMGHDWRDVVGGSLDVSEFLLYGTYAMTLAEPSARTNVSADSLCHSHWDPIPLDLDGARRFVDAAGPTDLAIHIQSNSQTPAAVLEYVAQHAGPDTAAR